MEASYNGRAGKLTEHLAQRTDDLEGVLGKVIARVKELVGAGRAGVFLLDPAKNELVLQRPAIGFDEAVIPLIRLPLESASPTVGVFHSGRPFFTNDMAHHPGALPEIVKILGSKTSLVIPLEVDGVRIGLLSLTSKEGGFTKTDLRLATLLCSYLGVLIHNIHLLENERQTATKLQRTLAIHDDLTRMVLDGKGVESITTYLSRFLANPVTVVDRFGNTVCAYPREPTGAAADGGGTPIMGNRLGAGTGDSEAKGILADLARALRPIRMPVVSGSGFGQTRVFAPIVVGCDLLAYLSVQEINRPLDDPDLMAVERAATAIALQMMKEKAAAEAQFKLIADLVTTLIEGDRASGDMPLRRAAYLGIDLNVPRAALVVDIDDFARFVRERTEEQALALKGKLLEVVRRTCNSAGVASITAMKNDEVIVLAEIPGQRPEDAPATLRALGDSIRIEVSRWLPDISVSVGIGLRCDNLAGYGQSYQQARRALESVKASRQANRTVTFDQLGAIGILFDPNFVENLVTTVNQSIGRLLEYDRRNGSQLIETLEQYFAHDCRLDPAAAALGVQNGTVRYRLSRVQEISGANLHDPDCKLNLQIALKLRRAMQLQ